MQTKTEEKPFSLADWKTPGKPAIEAYKKTLIEKYKTYEVSPSSISIKADAQSTNITAELNGNIISSFSDKDAFVILTKEPQYYIRFGALLNYIKDNIILKIKNPSKEGIFNINTDFRTQKMYSLPNRISLDPRVCIVRNSKINIGSFSYEKLLKKDELSSDALFKEDTIVTSYEAFSSTFKTSFDANTLTFTSEKDKTAQAFHGLEPFTDEDNGGTNKNSAYILNIYLNFDFILESLSADDKGNISVYNLLSKICTGLNKALGGINNLEPIIDETSNTLQIIDTTPIPKTQKEPGYTLQIYGYNKIDSTNKGYLGNNYISNFVRKVDLKTVITPEYATMITVGATAGGYVKGVEATAFSKWNTGLTDRFKKDILPPKGDKSSLDDDEATSNYEDAFRDHTRRYGITSLGGFNSKESITNINFSNNLINKNISVMTEYYKYLVATSTRGKSTSGGTVGFIPFKLSLTMDGISGIKIYDVLHVDTKFLPKAYGRTVDLIVTGISHRLANNDWETSIEATVMPKTSEFPQSTNSSPTPPNTTVTGTGLQSVESSQPITGTEKISNLKRIASYLKSLGLTKEGTMGLLGNILGESGANPKIAEKDGAVGGKGGIGIVQWTASRRRKLEAEANNNNNTIKDLNFQLKFLGKELQKSYKSTFTKLSNSTSIEESTVFVLEKFEVPGTYLKRKENPEAYEKTKKRRISYAKSTLSIVNEIYS
jgi:hypothetical protein